MTREFHKNEELSNIAQSNNTAIVAIGALIKSNNE
jgi:hypothetical protein